MKPKDLFEKLGLNTALIKRRTVDEAFGAAPFTHCDDGRCIYCWSDKVEDTLNWFITFLAEQGAPGLDDAFKTAIVRLLSGYFDSIQRILHYIWCVAPQDIRDRHGLSDFPLLLVRSSIDTLRRDEKMHKSQ